MTYSNFFKILFHNMIGLMFPVIIWIDIQGTKQVAASSVVMGFGIYMLVVLILCSLSHFVLRIRLSTTPTDSFVSAIISYFGSIFVLCLLIKQGWYYLAAVQLFTIGLSVPVAQMARKKRALDANAHQCVCTIVDPCHPNCSCHSPQLAKTEQTACLRCCSGIKSEPMKIAMALVLARSIDHNRNEELRELRTLLAQDQDEATTDKI